MGTRGLQFATIRNPAFVPLSETHPLLSNSTIHKALLDSIACHTPTPGGEGGGAPASATGQSAAHLPGGPGQPLLVAVLGPTGSGKTALSLTLARRLQGEIVSCDSVAVYRDMEIGTAKPSHAERREIPHHLIDVLPPAQYMTVAISPS